MMKKQLGAFLPVKDRSEHEIRDRALQDRMKGIRQKLLVLSGSPTAEAFEHAIQPILDSNSHDSNGPADTRAGRESAVSV
jgi:hypothetical protein